MTLKRLDDWPEKLAEFIHARTEKVFEWGQNDCAIFAADGIHAITEIDVAADLRGTYSTASQAVDIVTARGGLEAIATSVLGEPMENKLMIQRGDVALVKINGRESLTICIGSELAGPGVDFGVVLIPIMDAIKVWKV